MQWNHCKIADSKNTSAVFPLFAHLRDQAAFCPLLTGQGSTRQPLTMPRNSRDQEQTLSSTEAWAALSGLPNGVKHFKKRLTSRTQIVNFKKALYKLESCHSASVGSRTLYKCKRYGLFFQLLSKQFSITRYNTTYQRRTILDEYMNVISQFNNVTNSKCCPSCLSTRHERACRPEEFRIPCLKALQPHVESNSTYSFLEREEDTNALQEVTSKSFYTSHVGF